MLAIQIDKGYPVVFPGFPQLKLWPEAAASLGDDPKTLPRVGFNSEKRARRVVGGFVPSPLPLRRIYVLTKGETQEVKPLRPQEDLYELARHTYVSPVLQPTESPAHLHQCASVVRNVGVRSLSRPKSLRALRELAELVKVDLARSAGQVSDGN